MYPDKLIDRFWSKVARCPHGDICAECCWLWQAGTCRDYGTFFVPEAFRMGHAKVERANRVVWQMLHGRIPAGLHVLHDCPAGDNPRCVNPAHLWLGTIDDNQKDSMRKGTRPRGDQHGLRLHPEALHYGEKNSQAKLTEQQVRTIFALKGKAYQKDVARRFHVSRSLIGLIWQRKVWQ